MMFHVGECHGRLIRRTEFSERALQNNMFFQELISQFIRRQTDSLQ